MPDSPSNFAEAIEAAGAAKHPRNPAQWTPRACEVYNSLLESNLELARLLDAAIAWEITSGRVARPGDESAVRECRRRMDEATARAEVAKA